MTSDEAIIGAPRTILALIGAPRTIVRVAFLGLTTVTAIVLFLAETLAAEIVGWALGFRIRAGWIGGLAFPNLILANHFADRILKRVGLSRIGTTREVLGRTVALLWRSGTTREVCGRTVAFVEAEGTVADDETVEARLPPTFIRWMILGCLVGCSIFTLLATLSQIRGTAPRGCSVFVAFFGLGMVYFIYAGIWGMPQAWANSAGIWGLPSASHLKARFVPWSAVATCEIATYHDTFGKPILIRPTLMGVDGRPLLTPILLNTRIEDQERLVRFIRAKLPKTQPDPLDW